MNKIENNLNSYNTMMGGANAATAAAAAGAAPPGAVPPGAVPPEAAAAAPRCGPDNDANHAAHDLRGKPWYGENNGRANRRSDTRCIGHASEGSCR